MELSLERLAEELMFGRIKTKEQLDEKIKDQWQYRKNKDISDVNKAIKLGLKLGCGRTENEIDGVTLYLNDVFKKIRNKKTT